MSNVTVLEKKINDVSTNFNELAEIHGAVNFRKECSFAVQALQQNSYLYNVAYKNPESLQFAVMNIASIGLSLNPAIKHAYLVPRGNKVVLDISYMGLVQLACESGAIKWVQSQLVYEKDHYQFKGVGQAPEHSFNSFSDRGSIIGVYVVAKTEDGEFLVEQMSIEEAHSIRDRTEAWKAYNAGKTKSCPWSTDEGEMIKKTAVKRAYKMWPKNDKRMHDAVKVLNDDNGEGIIVEENTICDSLTSEQEKEIEASIKELDRTPEKFLAYFSNVIKKNISSIGSLTMDEAETALIQLRTMIQNKNNKEG